MLHALCAASPRPAQFSSVQLSSAQLSSAQPCLMINQQTSLFVWPKSLNLECLDFSIE
jgi:hypothetical protein